MKYLVDFDEAIKIQKREEPDLDHRYVWGVSRNTYMALADIQPVPSEHPGRFYVGEPGNSFIFPSYFLKSREVEEEYV